MRKFRQLCAGLILTLALTAIASAGQMDCPGVTSTAPQATGYMPSGITDVLLVILALI